MAETLSTVDMPVRWANKAHEARQKADTSFFLFLNGVGDLVVWEPMWQKCGLEETSSNTTDPIPTKQITTHTRTEDVRVPRAKRVSTHPQDRYILLKKYEGFVTSRGEQSFAARLFESSSDYPVLEAEFDLEELSETDRELVIEGAALVWTIGYGYDGSTRKRESTIYLRRLPPWSKNEIEQGKQAAKALTRAIQWE